MSDRVPSERWMRYIFGYLASRFRLKLTSVLLNATMVLRYVTEKWPSRSGFSAENHVDSPKQKGAPIVERPRLAGWLRARRQRGHWWRGRSSRNGCAGSAY